MFTKRCRRCLTIVICLLLLLLVWTYLPIGRGHWNDRQINKIQTAPVVNDFCFAVLANNRDGFDVFHRIIKDLNRQNFIFAIDIGDLVSDGDKEKYRIFYDQIKNSKNPFLTAIGNHDTKTNGRINYYNVFGDFYYSFGYGDSLFVVLDDANMDAIDSDQLDFLALQLSRNFKHKFVFLHVPPFDPRRNPEDVPKIIGQWVKPEHRLSNLANAREFMSMMSEYKVETVFASQSLGYFENADRSVKYVVTGGAGTEITHLDSEHYFYNYVKVCLVNGAVTHEVVKISPPDNNNYPLNYLTWPRLWYIIIVNRTVLILSSISLILVIGLIYEYRDKLARIFKRPE